MANFRHQIFVCENQRDPGNPKGCCAAKDSPAIREAIKEEIEKRGWRKIVRASSSGCLDQCAIGPTLVVYPENIWYAHVSPADVPAILDGLKSGEPLARLRVPEEQLSGRPHSGPLP